MSQYRIISFCKRTINIINCAQEGASLITKQGPVKKQMCICFNIKATQAKWIQSILKTMFNLCSCKSFRLRHSLVRYLVPLQLWQLKTLSGDGLINFKQIILKTRRLAALRKLGSSFFHSITVEGKK